MNQIVFVLSPNGKLGVLTDEVAQVYVRKDPLRICILTGYWVLVTVLLEVLLQGLLLE